MKRLEYLDVSKVVAIYLVTFAHCAQVVCGEKFPNLLVSKDSFISINMAIFMIASGFVMNIDKMKATPTTDYFFQKAFRLLVPMTSWYAVMCLVTLSVPSLPTYWSLYWYLGAMFVCLSLVKVLTCFIGSIPAVCLLSILILSLLPMISFERSCYMIPFLWVGYGLRHIIDRITKPVIVVLVLAYAVLYYFWDISYSIYVTPFHIWNISIHSVQALVFRFVIGTVGGVSVICLLRVLMEPNTCKEISSSIGSDAAPIMRGPEVAPSKNSWLNRIAKYGPYTLGFYTMSFVLNAMLVRVLWHTNWFVSSPGLLDIASFVVTTLMMVVMYYTQKLLERYKITRSLFLGMK